MALKKLDLSLQPHLICYLNYEFSNRNGTIHVKKSSWLGGLIHLSSMYIPHTQKFVEPKGDKVSIQYYTREKVFDVPNQKIPFLIGQIEQTFRLALVNYVLGQRLTLQSDYSPYIKDFLGMIGYEPDEEKEWEKIRKIYRDHEDKISRKNQKRFA